VYASGGNAPVLQPAPQLFTFGKSGGNRVAPIDESAVGGDIELATASDPKVITDGTLHAEGKEGFATFSRSSVISDIPLEETAARTLKQLPQPDENKVEAVGRPTSSLGRQPSRQPSQASVNKTPVLSEALPGAVNDVPTPQPPTTTQVEAAGDPDGSGRPAFANDLETTSLPDVVWLMFVFLLLSFAIRLAIPEKYGIDAAQSFTASGRL
jgi:hypothetical protein